MVSSRIDPSTRHSGERGFSLIEVIISVGLLAVVSLSVAQLFVAATEATLSAREQTTTAILASQKMEQLRGLTWGFEPDSGLPVSDTTTDLTVDPPSPGGGGLSPSPAGVLTTNLPGYVDYLDAQGGWIGRGVAPPAGTCYVRRWSITPLPASPGRTLILQVLVTTLRRELRRAQAVLPGRLLGDTWLVTVKTRKTS